MDPWLSEKTHTGIREYRGSLFGSVGGASLANCGGEIAEDEEQGPQRLYEQVLQLLSR